MKALAQAQGLVYSSTDSYNVYCTHESIMNGHQTTLTGNPSETGEYGHPMSALPPSVNSRIRDSHTCGTVAYFLRTKTSPGSHLSVASAYATIYVFDAPKETLGRLPRLHRIFETLYDGVHPLRIAPAKLQSLNKVRIFEGKEMS